MPAPYPTWFREKVIAAYEVGEGTFEELGVRFKIGEATVNRWVSRKRRLGTLEPKRREKRGRKRIVDDKGEQFIRNTLKVLPCSTLRECLRRVRGGIRQGEDLRLLGGKVRFWEWTGSGCANCA